MELCAFIAAPSPPCAARLALALSCRNLQGLGLQGSIPAEGWTLPDTLEILDISSNSLSGELPQGALVTPPTGLKLLSASDNQLSGKIPSDLTLPESLEALTLAANLLTGGALTFGRRCCAGSLCSSFPWHPEAPIQSCFNKCMLVLGLHW